MGLAPEPLPAASPPAPEDLADRAGAPGDEPAIKLTEACLRLHAQAPDPVLLPAAARASELLGRRQAGGRRARDRITATGAKRRQAGSAGRPEARAGAKGGQAGSAGWREGRAGRRRGLARRAGGPEARAGWQRGRAGSAGWREAQVGRKGGRPGALTPPRRGAAKRCEEPALVLDKDRTLQNEGGLPSGRTARR
jgi:hypothetical protein